MSILGDSRFSWSREQPLSGVSITAPLQETFQPEEQNLHVRRGDEVEPRWLLAPEPLPELRLQRWTDQLLLSDLPHTWVQPYGAQEGPLLPHLPRYCKSFVMNCEWMVVIVLLFRELMANWIEGGRLLLRLVEVAKVKSWTLHPCLRSKFLIYLKPRLFSL